MKQMFYRFFAVLLILSTSVHCFSQDISLKVLNAISYSDLPFCDKKGVPFNDLVGLDSPSKVPDVLYTDLQCTQYINAGDKEDLAPALYAKIKLPSNLILGVLTYGGATDYRTDQLFICDASGKILSTLEGTVMNSVISIKQYQITKEYKVIVSQLMLTSQKPILYEDFIGTGEAITAYRLDTTYRIDSGKFIKEGEEKHPTKSYTEKQMIENEIWDL